jgi:hypothetical protein
VAFGPALKKAFVYEARRCSIVSKNETGTGKSGLIEKKNGKKKR